MFVFKYKNHTFVISGEHRKIVCLTTQSSSLKGWWPCFIILLFSLSSSTARSIITTQMWTANFVIYYSSHTVLVHRPLGCFCSLSSTYEEFLFCFGSVPFFLFCFCFFTCRVIMWSMFLMDTTSARSPSQQRREDNGTFRHRQQRRGNNMKNKMIIALWNKRIVPNIKGLFCEHSQIRLAWEDVFGLCNRDGRLTPHQEGNQWLEQVWRSAPSQLFRKKTKKYTAGCCLHYHGGGGRRAGASRRHRCVLVTSKHNQGKSREAAHLIGSESPHWKQMTVGRFIFLSCKCTAVRWKSGGGC